MAGGKKRKADTKMWGSPSSSNSSSRRKGASSSRRGGSGSGGSGYGGPSSSSSGINEGKAEKMFDELTEEDDPGAANMEGELVICLFTSLEVYGW